jgi:site-specific DNA-methyltransferase (adenine-specific)
LGVPLQVWRASSRVARVAHFGPRRIVPTVLKGVSRRRTGTLVVKARIMVGDCAERLRELEPESVDAVVTDPPYGLGFMGKAWDHAVPSAEVWCEVLRVLKPGGHMVAFFGSRTYHRGAVAIEDAGFEIRDQLMWIYGSGFPKSLNVAIAIDKQAGAMAHRSTRLDVVGNRAQGEDVLRTVVTPAHEPITEDAKRWSGWGTALKPAHEPIALARKPFRGTVSANVLEHGTGAINVDACRIQGGAWTRPGSNAIGGVYGGFANDSARTGHDAGRWPANVMHDGADDVLEHFPRSDSTPYRENIAAGDVLPLSTRTAGGFSDSGSAARFFYTAKASADDRNEELPSRVRNRHPTVKPVDLMRWLVRLIAPPGGVVLDPFMGSGSTGKAAMLEGFDFVGCELDPAHAEIAELRISGAGGLFCQMESDRK